MRFANPYIVRLQEPKETILFAAAQDAGSKNGLQQDYFLNFNDECFVLADGVSTRKLSEAASKLACETAIWGYKHIRQHRFYFQDKKRFMKRIFRSTNLAVWQKQKEVGFKHGIATTLLVVMIGPKHYWVGHAGDTSAWHLRSGVIKKLTTDHVDREGALQKAVGFIRLGLVPDFTTGELISGDMMLLMTDGIEKYLKPSQILAVVDTPVIDIADAQKRTVALINAAKAEGSTSNMTVVLIARV